MERSATNVHSTLHICWGAQAGIYYHYGIQKHELPKKLSGVFSHRVVKASSPLVRGFDDTFDAPHSRYTEVRAADIEAHPNLELIAVSDEAGVYIAKSTDSRHFFVFGHPEYDRGTLAAEYERDIAKGLDIDPPAHYFPDDDPSREPRSSWRAHSQLLYTNWLNYYVYQTTPYDVRSIGRPGSTTVSVPARDSVPQPDADDAMEGEASAGQRTENVRMTSENASDLSECTNKSLESPVQHAAKPAPAAARPAPRDDNPYLRASNEDDDGYDPYSDRREEPPLFERDPWW